ncbi:MAG: ABC transporter ATP-binding protein [Planctomycetes bacterium]|nr:ABC transporter ATP-binding protein [Planctomycetota bacterium]
MSDVAIRVEGLGKRYRIGAWQAYRTFREALMNAARAPLRLFRRNGHGSEDRTLWALKDVSFEVKEGEIVGIIGANGAGKSTLLKILSRITEPAEGRAEVRGRVRALLEVGTGFHPELTGRENIYLNGAILGMKRAEIARKFDEIVAFSEIERFLDTPVKHYSSGMYVRLAFAVAAHLEPDVLLVDEVLAVGDAAFQKKCLNLMSDVAAKRGRTILFVSHNMSVIDRLCGRAVLLEGGRIAADGPAGQVVGRYLAGRTTCEGAWKRPASMSPSQDLTIRSVRAKGPDGRTSASFRGDEPIAIEVEYEVHRPLESCAISAAICNAMEIQVTYTADSDSRNVSGLPKEPGRYRTGFVLPGHFLASGRYTVALSAHLVGLLIYDTVLDSVAFEVQVAGSVESLDYRKPIVAPVLEWDTERRDAGVEARNGTQGP